MFKKTAFVLLAATVSAACSDNGEEPGPVGPGGEAAVTFELRIAESGEAREWRSGDEVGLYAVRAAEGLAPSGNYLHNVRLVYGGDGTWRAAEAVEWPADGASLDFYAYYPWTESADDPSEIAFRVSSDQESEPERSVLLAASASGCRPDERVTLTFSHLLVPVSVVAVEPEAYKGYGPGEGMAVDLMAVAVSGRLDLRDLSVEADAAEEGTVVRMHCADASSYRYRAWLPAQTVAGGAELLRFESMGGQRYVGEALEADLVLTAGEPAVLERSVKLLQTEHLSAGVFMMGSPETEQGRYPDEPLHQVTLTRDFLMCRYEITCMQFADFLNDAGVGEDGMYVTEEFGEQLLVQANKYSLQWSEEGWIPAGGRENAAVACVSWYGANEYARWAGGSLPSEAQWEYACRAETQTRFSFGDDASLMGDYAWYWGGMGSPVVYYEDVGSKLPNPWGLYDMHGGVKEWCLDNRATQATVPEDYEPAVDPISPRPGPYYLLRGGSFISTVNACRSAARESAAPRLIDSAFGLRILFPL